MSNETRPGQQRYWCHICNAEVNIYMAPEPTCQRCNEQFIEELQSDDDPREFLAGTDNHTHIGEGGGIHIHDGGAHIFSSGRMSGEMGDDIFQYFTPSNTAGGGNTAADESTEGGNPPLGNLLQNLLTNMLGQNVELNGINTNEDNEPGSNRTPRMYVGSMVDGNVRFQPMPGMMPTGDENDENTNNTEENGAGTPGGTGARGNSIASIMQFLSAMTGAPLDGGLVGNPNDYVFSQNALDNIITQLMEQTGGASAPPPAPEQIIESLPKRALTDEEKRTETDCAVCKDQFEPHEMVIELPCEHIFHDDCIKPWLKLNGTCPVCRHSVLPEQESNNNNNNNNNNNSNINTQSQQNNDTPSEGNNNSNNNNNNNTTTTTSNVWIGGTASNGTTQWPLNLSAAFPWATPANRPNNTNTSSTTTTTNTNTTSNNTHIDEDLDLD